jgi:hypothetical protein
LNNRIRDIVFVGIFILITDGLFAQTPQELLIGSTVQGNVARGGEQWYTITPSSDGYMVVQTLGTSFSPDLVVYDSSWTVIKPHSTAGVRMVDANNRTVVIGGRGGLNAQIQLFAEAGKTYLFKLRAYYNRSDSGPYQMSTTFVSDSGILYAPEEDGTLLDIGNLAIAPSDNELASLLATASNPNAVVSPLIQTKWTQSGIFSSLYPAVNGQPSICGCVNLAWAQLLMFHQHPARGSGQGTKIITVSQGDTLNITIPSVNFNVAYDWNNMISSYRSGGRDSNERQRNAVATLVHHIGVARGTFGTVAAMPTAFGYDRSIQKLERQFFTDAEWEAIIRQQLDAGLPVLYWGRDTNTAHGFIVDGYDSTGSFHINWGWGGRYDEWYTLNNLNPRGRREFYNNQYIIINIKPNAGGVGSNDLGLLGFTTSKTTISQNELITVTPNISSFGFFPGGQVGAAVVDNNNRIVAVIGRRNMDTTWQPGSKHEMAMNCFIPETVSPGQYRLMAVTRLTNREWRIATLSVDNSPTSIDFTVR